MAVYGGWLAFSAVSLARLLATVRRPASRRRRHGGYVKPPASSAWSPPVDGELWIPRIPVVSSSSTPPGDPLADWARHRARAQANKKAAPTSSGSATEDRGGSGRTRPVSADSVKPFPPGAELLRRNRGDDAA